ncbi:hypothetical protein RIF29_28579 [Crotalaria pallida]|uniref:Uncharacterized protein n=1 Tax=Crotalaria pallida TaxID=3830 RepID=A0AAN9HWN0_CROPI
MALLLHRHKTKLNTFTITNPSLLHRLFSTAGDKPPSNSQFSVDFKRLKEIPGQRSPLPPISFPDQMSLPAYKDMLKMRLPKVIGGTSGLPRAIFGDKGKGDGYFATAMRTEFVKLYTPEDLGEKLRNLRPERKEKDWFSIKDLSERLMRLREMDKFTDDLKDSLIKMKEAEKDKRVGVSLTDS